MNTFKIITPTKKIAIEVQKKAFELGYSWNPRIKDTEIIDSEDIGCIFLNGYSRQIMWEDYDYVEAGWFDKDEETELHWKSFTNGIS